MIAPRRRDDSGGLRMCLPQILKVDEAPANLECADRRMILVLYPHLRAAARRQERPAILRGRRDNGPDLLRRRFEFREADGRHERDFTGGTTTVWP